jgi:fimbrial chaperone protein
MKERFIKKAAILAAFFSIFGAYASLAVAALDVSPVRVNLAKDNDKGTVRVSNHDETEKSYQVEIVAWTQTDERREIYEPTEELIAVPPLFTLQPGEHQVVRVGLISEPDKQTERAYRMFITELVPPQTGRANGVSINMRLQIGIPVFVAPTEGLPIASLDFVDSMQIDNQLFMKFRNNGNQHVKITQIQHSRPGMAEKSVTPISFYVLPGKAGYVPVALPDGKPVGNVSLVTDTVGTLEYELPLAP